MRYRVLLFCILFLGFMPTHAFAEGTQVEDGQEGTPEASAAEVKQQALQLLEAQKPGEAYELLRENLATNEQEVEYLFLTGMAALDSTRLREAIGHFEDALEIDPNLPRVRLELARAYSAAGKNRSAKAEFRKVLETNPPPQVRDNIERFMAVLDSQRVGSARVNRVSV